MSKKVRVLMTLLTSSILEGAYQVLAQEVDEKLGEVSSFV
jgi:hypothetical protein